MSEMKRTQAVRVERYKGSIFAFAKKTSGEQYDIKRK
jgi:hypothetical protein